MFRVAVKKEDTRKRRRSEVADNDDCVEDLFSTKRAKKKDDASVQDLFCKRTSSSSPKRRPARKRTQFSRKKASSSMRRAGSCVTEIEAAEFGGKSFVQATREHKKALEEIYLQLRAADKEFQETTEDYVKEASLLMNLSVRRYTRMQSDTPESHRELYYSHANLARKTAAVESVARKTHEKVEALHKKLACEIEKTKSLGMHYWHTQQNQLSIMEIYAYRRPLFRREDIEMGQPPMILTPFTEEEGQAATPFV